MTDTAPTAGPTADARLQKLQEDQRRAQAEQRRRDVVKLLQLPEFRRFVADLVYGVGPGRAGLKAGGSWRRDAEIHKVAARKDFAVEVLAELGRVDPAGFLLLEQEHVNRMAEDLENLAILNQEQVR